MFRVWCFVFFFGSAGVGFKARKQQMKSWGEIPTFLGKSKVFGRENPTFS